MWTFITSWITPTSLFLFLNLMIGTMFITSRFGSDKNPRYHYQVGPDNSPQLVRAPSLLQRVRSIDFSFYKFPPPNPETDYLLNARPEDTNPVDPPQLVRAPSLLDRVRSIDFSLYKFQPSNPENDFLQNAGPENTNPVDPPQLTRAPSLLDRVKSINFSSFYGSEQPNPETQFTTEPASNITLDSDLDHGHHEHHHVNRSKSETKQSPARQPEKMKKSASEKSRMGMSEEKEDMEIVERRRPSTARIEKTVSIGDGDHGVDAKADDFINRFKQQLKLQRLDSLLRYKEMLKGK